MLLLLVMLEQGRVEAGGGKKEVTGRWQYAAGGGDSSAEDTISRPPPTSPSCSGWRSWLTRGFAYSPEIHGLSRLVSPYSVRSIAGGHVNAAR